MADRKRSFWLALVEDVLFRVAFIGFIFLEFVIFILFLWGISKILPEDNPFIAGALIVLALISPFVIGSVSYLVFQRFTRAQYVLAESERWLAERREAQKGRINRRKTVQQLALWIPTVTVIFVCIVFDYTWAVASHLLHPGAGKLIGYEVPIPITWSIYYRDTTISPNDASSIVVAQRYRGLLKAGSGLYVGRQPFSISGMQFRSTPSGDPSATGIRTEIISTRVLALGKETIECREETPPGWMKSEQYIWCSTPTGAFSASFHGSNEDATEFYRVLQSVKRSE